MNENNVAHASINSFGPKPEEQIFVLTASQLSEMVAAACQDALKSTISSFQDEILALREEVALERATDRRRIAELERGNIQPMQRDRAEILRALLAANEGKMFAKDARQRMGLSETVFSRLLATMLDRIEVRPFHADRKKNVLILRAAKG